MYEYGGMSLSARRVWIEIDFRYRYDNEHCVALRKESVDRNTLILHRVGWLSVALRKESVDRNLRRFYRKNGIDGVALRKESVDRNTISARVLLRFVCRSPQGECG